MREEAGLWQIVRGASSRPRSPLWPPMATTTSLVYGDSAPQGPDCRVLEASSGQAWRHGLPKSWGVDIPAGLGGGSALTPSTQSPTLSLAGLGPQCS